MFLGTQPLWFGISLTEFLATDFTRQVQDMGIEQVLSAPRSPVAKIPATDPNTRARMSQIILLSDLAPEIQEELLFLPKMMAGPDRFTEKSLRQIARSIDWDWQKQQFRALGEQTL